MACDDWAQRRGRRGRRLGASSASGRPRTGTRPLERRVFARRRISGELSICEPHGRNRVGGYCCAARPRKGRQFWRICRCGAGRYRARKTRRGITPRSEEHTSELQSPCNLVCRLLLEKKKNLSQLVSSAEVALALRRRVTFSAI